jgi:hypothetical protein
VVLRCNRGSFRASRSVADGQLDRVRFEDAALLGIRQRIGNDP